VNAEEVKGGALDYIFVKPDGVTETAGYPLVIMLHGFGSNMYDLTGLAPELNATGYVYAFPNAPYSLQIGPGMVGYSWALGRPGMAPAPAEEPPIEQRLDAFMETLVGWTGAEAGRIVLGGFSQGGGLSLRYGLPRPETFRGVADLSGFFRDADLVKPLLPADKEQRVFIAHGRQDPTVAIDMARETKAFLEAEGYAPRYHEYDMGHSVSAAEVEDLRAWLHETLPPQQ
jgi:phospholipase/carboxylesterase